MLEHPAQSQSRRKCTFHFYGKRNLVKKILDKENTWYELLSVSLTKVVANLISSYGNIWIQVLFARSAHNPETSQC